MTQTLIMRTVFMVVAGGEGQFAETSRAWVARTEVEEGVEFFAVTFDDDNSEGTFLEIYSDVDAFTAHAARTDSDLRGSLYEVATLKSYDVYGQTTPQLQTMLAGANPRYHRIEASRTGDNAT